MSENQEVNADDGEDSDWHCSTYLNSIYWRYLLFP